MLKAEKSSLWFPPQWKFLYARFPPFRDVPNKSLAFASTRPVSPFALMNAVALSTACGRSNTGDVRALLWVLVSGALGVTAVTANRADFG